MNLRRAPLLLAPVAAVALLLVATPAFAATSAGAAGDDIFSRALGGGIILAFGAAYLAGIATCATPCVYPMIGVTVSVFGAKQAKSRRESAILSLFFVLGIATLYTPFGVIVAMTHSVWGRALSSPWVGGGLAILFAAMAASMFGAFELALPSSLQNKLASVGGVGKGGAFLIGLVSGLIASPCTTAPFASIIASFSKTGAVVGGTSVFLFSIGLGTPFFLVGTFAARLPKPGAWMQHVKSFFGVVLLVIALRYAKPVLPILKKAALGGAMPFVIALGAVVVGVAIGAIHLSFGDGSSFGVKARKAIGILLCTAGAFLLISFRGFHPRRGIDWMNDPAAAEQLARAEGRPMIIDFTADWCTACHEMEDDTFTDPEFTDEAKRFVALRIDGTNQDAPIFAAYSARFEIPGLPTVIILDSSGKPSKVFNERVGPTEMVSALQAAN